MRTIKVTGGFSDYVVARLTETKRKSLALSDIRMCLVPQGQQPPARTSPLWLPASLTEFTTPYDVRVSLLVDETFALGLFNLWTLTIDNPTATPVKATNHLISVV